MLTVFAWLVFIPALIINIVFFFLTIHMVRKGKYAIRFWRNILETAVTFLIMMVPGIYLFGIW